MRRSLVCGAGGGGVSGRSRPRRLRALPYLVRYYGIIRRASATQFDVRRAAGMELEWWIVHRERLRRPPGDLDRSLAELAAELYHVPAERFADHARARAEAMTLRDDRAAAGSVTELDWRRIGGLLDASWSSLHSAVSRAKGSLMRMSSLQRRYSVPSSGRFFSLVRHRSRLLLDRPIRNLAD